MVNQISLFQSDKIAEFWDSIPGMKSVTILAKRNDVEVGRLYGALFNDGGVKGYLSRRVIIWGGPYIHVHDDENGIFEELLLELLQQLKGKAIYIEFRNSFDCQKYKPVFEKLGFEFAEHLNYLVPLDDEKTVLKRMSESKVRQIKKTVKAGVEVIDSPSASEIEEYYALLSKLYEEKVKTPLPPIVYFTSFAGYGLGGFLLLRYEGRIIGGIMIGVDGERVYEMYICGEDGKYTNIYPSVLATWAAIKYGIDKGLKYFDFLGAGRPDQSYGVREFKAKFGGELVNYGRYKLVLHKPLYMLGTFGVQLLKKVSWIRL